MKQNQPHQFLFDVLIIIFLAIAAATLSFQHAQQIDSIILENQTINVFFESDIPRVFANMSNPRSNYSRTEVHPLFPLIAYPPTWFLKTAFGLDSITAVKIVIAAVAAIWISTLFILLRLIGCRRFDAGLFSLLGTTSAAAIFWFAVPETYSFGSLTMLLALIMVALAQKRHFSNWWYIGISVITMSVTVTNWMAGILATLANNSLKNTLRITIKAFLIVVSLTLLQVTIFSDIRPPFSTFWSEFQYMLVPESGGPVKILASFFLHTMIMPVITFTDNPVWTEWPFMRSQFSALASRDLLSLFALLSWTLLLGLGLWALVTLKQHLRFRLVLGGILVGQLTLHLLYGNETFLYSLHWIPLLIVLTALSTLTRARPVALVLTSAIMLYASVNNTKQLSEVAEYFKSQGPSRHQVNVQMQQRPTNPWPRGTGHVILARPGSNEVDKAYHEPGGNFSPAVNSFGVEIWITDNNKNLVATSQDIPLDTIQQKFTWYDDYKLPWLDTDTPYYQATWHSNESNDWVLDITTKKHDENENQLNLIIRSVGPAGGPVKSLDWDGARLMINNHWIVKFDPPPLKVDLGDERRPGWIINDSNKTKWKDDHGWGFARCKLSDNHKQRLIIEDSVTKPTLALRPHETQSALELKLPDERFSSSLNAQVAHLTMSTVDRQTRPGDPINYPLAWQRDGAYVIVALARAGQLALAKELSINMAENDFYGGFGSEADAPGLGIWALLEVAIQLQQPEYGHWLWPHVRRKAEFILAMLAARHPLHQAVTGPIVPKYKGKPHLSLVSLPAQDNLIVGRMDHHFPRLFVNAVSYRGLLDASSLATQTGHLSDARRWRKAASTLQLAWVKAFKTERPDINLNAATTTMKLAWETGFMPPESVSMHARGAALKIAAKQLAKQVLGRTLWQNERTYIASMWPTGIASPVSDLFLERLDTRWRNRRDDHGGFLHTPSWTYFELAETHQWLLLGQQQRVWNTLNWFWNHQASPGLYSWWEGHGEENTFHRWERVRGWINPPHVTPHYWTAAEMLLLQLDMLAYLDETMTKPTILIGAGIPSAWLKEEMEVKGLHVKSSQVDWLWDGKKMHVKIYGTQLAIQLGKVFPDNTPIIIEHLPSRKNL